MFFSSVSRNRPGANPAEQELDRRDAVALDAVKLLAVLAELDVGQAPPAAAPAGIERDQRQVVSEQLQLLAPGIVAPDHDGRLA
jgi:hypothetical protein